MGVSAFADPQELEITKKLQNYIQGGIYEKREKLNRFKKRN
jgi:hypothetical protein